MTSKQHRSLFKPRSLEQLWKGKLKLRYKVQKFATVNYTVHIKKKYEAGPKKAQLNPKKKKSDCVFAIKHSGLAAKLDVVHWPFLVDTEGKGRAGKGEPETTSQSLPPRVQPRPSSSSSLTDCQLCQVHGGARMQGRIQEVPGFCFVPGEAEVSVRTQLFPWSSVKASTWSLWLPCASLQQARWRQEVRLTSLAKLWNCPGRSTNCSPHTRHGHIHLSPPPQPARNKASLIFQVC